MDAVTSTICSIQAVAGQTGRAANDMAHNVERLTQDAEQLARQISTFIGQVRAARSTNQEPTPKKHRLGPGLPTQALGQGPELCRKPPRQAGCDNLEGPTRGRG